MRKKKERERNKRRGEEQRNLIEEEMNVGAKIISKGLKRGDTTRRRRGRGRGRG
jgi:hypothetical protein